MILSLQMASSVQDSPVVQQTFVEEIDYSEIQELSVSMIDVLILVPGSQ